MIFNIAVGNNPRHLWEAMGDLVGFIKSAIESHGHTVMISDYAAISDGPNIFIDRFFKQSALAADLRNRRIRYGMIATEHIDAEWAIRQ
jgi:hypothetical protein